MDNISAEGEPQNSDFALNGFKEKEPRKIEEIEQEMKERGFSFCGQESLTRFKFDTEDGRFKVVFLQTREEIIDKFREDNKEAGEIEIELIDQEGLDQCQQAVYIFAKLKDK